MPRFNITMPQELWDRVGREAPEGNHSWFIRRALEATLENGKQAVGPVAPGKPSAVHPPASPPAPEEPLAAIARRAAGKTKWKEVPARQCEKCGREFLSPTLKRCTACNGKILPEPS